LPQQASAISHNRNETRAPGGGRENGPGPLDLGWWRAGPDHCVRHYPQSIQQLEHDLLASLRIAKINKSGPVHMYRILLVDDEPDLLAGRI
jgi:hypothetical protein